MLPLHSVVCTQLNVRRHGAKRYSRRLRMRTLPFEGGADGILVNFLPQVILNRLSWQRVWSLPAQDGTPTALAWRPDGKGMR